MMRRVTALPESTPLLQRWLVVEPHDPQIRATGVVRVVRWPHRLWVNYYHVTEEVDLESGVWLETDRKLVRYESEFLGEKDIGRWPELDFQKIPEDWLGRERELLPPVDPLTQQKLFLILGQS